jgi:methyl-accepting chemotaxis protein
MIRTLFVPAMAIMSRLNFALKIGLVGLLFLAPLAVLLVYQYERLHADIARAQNERVGIQQILPARFVLQSIQAHRATSQLALSGDSAAKDTLIILSAEVDKKLDALSESGRSTGASLELGDGFTKITKLWTEIKSNNSHYSREESLKKHSELVEEVLAYFALASDKAGLTLDPDIDSFYVMDVAVFRAGVLADNIGRLRAIGSGILRRRNVTPEEKTEIAILQRLFEKEFSIVQTDLAKAFGANGDLAAALGAKSAEALGATDTFLNADAAALAKGELTTEVDDYVKHATAALDSTYGLFDVAMEQLDGLIASRIGRLEGNVALFIGGAALVLMVVIYLFLGMLFSVLRSLRSIQAGAQRLANGDLSKRVDSQCRDELREVGAAVNSVAETFGQFTKAQLDMARAHKEEGRISHEMQASRFEGAYGDMAKNLNAMVKAHIDVQTRFVELMVSYANGDFGDRMSALPGERRAVSDTASRLRDLLLQAQEDAKETRKIKIALDNAASCVMMADNDGIIRYQNKAMKSLMQRSESGFRTVWPSFSAANIEGSSFDRFHKDPNHQRTVLGNLTSEHSAELKLAGSRIRLTVNPIVDENTARLGSVIECIEHTAETVAEQEVADIVEAAVAGDFSKRIAETGKSGFMLQVSQGLNSVLSTNEKALAEIARILRALAEGDLTQTIEAEYRGVFSQLKDDSNKTIERLRDIIAQIREASVSINTAAREIAAGNNDLSHRTEGQATNLEEAASSVEELASTVRQNAENAQNANRLASEASESARHGGEVVARVIDTMNGITESNREIADITTLIDGIAFQTNLLALNAAVEAARAGEQGRGFAVVASEVRTLAQRAADASRDIKGVIANSVSKVEDGAKLVGNAGDAMEGIVGQVQRVTAIMGEIAAASQEQSDGVQQVSQTVTQIDHITQQNAALVEEATAAAKSLEEQSAALVEAVAVFKLSGASVADAKRAFNGAAAGMRTAKALH